MASAERTRNRVRMLCTLDEEGPDLPRQVFDTRYRLQDRPVVVRNATRESTRAFRASAGTRTAP